MTNEKLDGTAVLDEDPQTEVGEQPVEGPKEEESVLLRISGQQEWEKGVG